MIKLLTTTLTTVMLAAYPVAAQSQSHLQAVVSHLVGEMEASVENADAKEVVVRMTTCEVQLQDNSASDKVYLYQEQALSDSLNQPYRQRLLEITPGETESTVVSKSYRLADQEEMARFCDRPENQRTISSANLDSAVCSVTLEPLINVYVGKTPPEGCPANVRGAVRITNTIILHQDGMDTWDRGFDAEGNQVWGAEEQSYQFRWRSTMEDRE